MSILLILNRLTQRHNVMYFEREKERETYVRDIAFYIKNEILAIQLVFTQ